MAGIEVKHRDDLAEDGGYSSRKMWLTILAMILIVGVGLLTGLTVFTALAPQLAVIVGGVLGALGIYAGANVSTKFASAGVRKAAEAAKAKAAAPAKPQPPVERG